MNSRRLPNSRQARLDWDTHIMAEETVMMADGTGMDLTADSIVVTFDAPNSFSFVVNQALPEQVRRIQWWFNMSPEGDGTKVSHEVEVDWGNSPTRCLLVCATITSRSAPVLFAPVWTRL